MKYKKKGLALASPEERAAKNDRKVGKSWNAEDSEKRNSRNKHGRRPHVWKKDDYGYENRQELDEVDHEIHTLPAPESRDDETPYWDRSTKATDEKFDEIRKRLKRRGYSDEEIDDILSDAVSLHD